MRIELAGYAFSSEPVSQSGRLFMASPTGEGTEIDESKLKELLDKFFEEVM